MSSKACLLSNVAEIIVGFPFESKYFNTTGAGTRLIRGVNVSSNGIRWGSDTRWWTEITTDLNKYQLREGDILLAMDGNVGDNRARLTKSDVPSLLVQRVACIRAKPGVSQDYLWACIDSKNFVAYIDSIKTGTTISHVSSTQIGQFPIPNKKYELQLKIGHIAHILDSKIKLDEMINDNLSAQLTAVFNKMFNPMIDSNSTVEPNIGWHQETIESISEEIGMGPFGSSIKVETFVKEGVPVISGTHLNDRIIEEKEYNYITNEHANHLKRSLVHSGDIVFTHAGNIGQVSIIPELSRFHEYIISQRQFFLRCNRDVISPLIMVEYFRSSKGQFELLSNASQTGVPSIARPTSHLKSISVLIPPKKLQDRYVEFASPIYTQICKYRREIESLISMRNYLLPKLMSGEIDVSPLEVPTK